MTKLFILLPLIFTLKSIAGIPFCNIAQLRQDGSPTLNSATEEFKKEETLVLSTPDDSARLVAHWNESFKFYQMSLVVKGVEVNSVIELPATSGHLNLWIDKEQGFTAQCRFIVD